jgi:hypothetical protein
VWNVKHGGAWSYHRTVYHNQGWINALAVVWRVGVGDGEDHEMLAVATNKCICFYEVCPFFSAQLPRF